MTPPGNGAAGRIPTCIVPFRRRMPHVFGHGSNLNWSERQDFHLRPPGPKPGALKAELHSEKIGGPEGSCATNPDPKRRTQGRSLQMPVKKCPTGTGLQVAFKSNRPIFILERGRRSDHPRTKLRCVWDFSGIMVLQSILQVLRLACVNLLRLRKRLQRIHVW